MNTDHLTFSGGLSPLPSGPVKATWVTRRVPADSMLTWAPVGRPAAGDLLLTEVLSPGLHRRIETPGGGRLQLYPGDLVIGALGARYATSSLEARAEVTGEEIDLVSASGVVGRVVQTTQGVSRPTRLRVVAQAFADGHPVNLSEFAIGPAPAPVASPASLLVVGSDMDSGKTTAVAALINGLARAGLPVGAAKLTGTTSSRDPGSFVAAGAEPVFDFLDVGLQSTAGYPIERLASAAGTIIGHLQAAPIYAAVMEIADGILQSDTAELLSAMKPALQGSQVVLTVREALAAVGGVERLRRLGYEVAAVSGVVSTSPLARREVELTLGIPCLTREQLAARAPKLALAPAARMASPNGVGRAA